MQLFRVSVPLTSHRIALGLCWLLIGTLAVIPARAQPAAVRTSPAQPAIGDESGTRQITSRFEIYNPHSEADLRVVQEMGFTQVVLDWPNLHPVATRLGLDVVMPHWWTAETDPNEIERAVEYVKQVERRHLASVSMMDEPERYAPETPFSFYQALYYDLRTQFDEELPGVPLEISHWGPLASWTDQQYQEFVPLYQATDRIRLMPYPDLHEGPLRDVYDQMLRSRQLMQLAGREIPQIVILQTWVMPEQPQLPTIDELRVMAYQALLAGAHTLSFFSYDPHVWSQSPGFTAGFTELMQELVAFATAYQRATVETTMGPDGILQATVTPPGNQSPLQVTVNTNRTAVAGLPALAVIWQTPHISQPRLTSDRHCPRPTHPRCLRRLWQRW